MRQIITIILGWLLSFSADGQHKYIVYNISGTCRERKNDKMSVLKIGDVLINQSVISISKQSSLVLLCDNFSIIALNPCKNLTLTSIADSCKAPSDAMTFMYLKYVWEQLSHPHESPEEERKKFMGNTGGVIRGCPMIIFTNSLDTIRYSKGNYPLRWKVENDLPERSFVLYESLDSEIPLQIIKTKGDSIDLSLIKQKFKSSTELYWTINIGKEACIRKYLELWKENDFNKFRDSIRSTIQLSLSNQEELYLMGYLMELNHFYAEAYQYYKKALFKDSANERYLRTVMGCRNIYGFDY